MAEVLQLSQATKRAAEDLARLGSLLHDDARTMNIGELEELVNDKNIAVVVVRDSDQIVGMGTLYVIPKIGKRNAYIEDVIVDEKYRGQGLGEKLTRKLITIAQEKGVRSITLTSRSERAAAHKLYEKLGFKTKETNVFQLKF